MSTSNLAPTAQSETSAEFEFDYRPRTSAGTGRDMLADQASIAADTIRTLITTQPSSRAWPLVQTYLHELLADVLDMNSYG
jgi:hypothetical protein